MTVANDISVPDRVQSANKTSTFPAKSVLLGFLTSAIVVFCVFPFLLVLAISFGRKVDGAAWVWDFTLENYQRFFVGVLWPQEVTFLYLQQLYYSFYFAVIASLLAVVTALPFTLALTRLSRRAQAIWLVFILSSLSLSEMRSYLLGCA